MSTTPRTGLPLLVAGQSQKEVTHNEALTVADALLMPVVQEANPATVPSSPSAGQCWIVGSSPTGAWQGHAHAIACWTEGGWRFVSPYNGFRVWCIADGMHILFDGAAWVKGIANASVYHVDGIRVVSARQAAIAGPTGGTVIDSETRIVVNSILAALRSHGLIAP